MSFSEEDYLKIIDAKDKRIAALSNKLVHYVKLLDEQHGTPCEQIRHAQQVEELESKLATEYERGRKEQREADYIIALSATANHSFAVCMAGEKIAKAIREQDAVNRQWPPPEQTCVNCGQYLGGGVQCCNNPKSPTDHDHLGE